MTEFEKNCYGMSSEDIREQYMNSITARFSGLEMVVMSILSDCQEMMAMGTGPRAVEHVRKQMNIAKFILSEMMEAKQAAWTVLDKSNLWYNLIMKYIKELKAAATALFQATILAALFGGPLFLYMLFVMKPW